MKTVEELLKEMDANKDLQGEFGQAVEADKLDEFLKKQDCEASVGELIDFVKAKESASKKLDADELKEVAGGRDKKCVTLFGKRLCI